MNFQITIGLISIAQWVTLNDWGFYLIAVTQSCLWGSETAVKKGRSDCRIHLTKGEEKVTGACMDALLLSGWIIDWNWYILWEELRVCLLIKKHLTQCLKLLLLLVAIAMKLLLSAKNQWRARYSIIIVNSLLSILVWE